MFDSECQTLFVAKDKAKVMKKNLSFSSLSSDDNTMTLRILAGKYKNFSLKVAHSQQLRPTSVMLRRKVFDAMQDLAGFQFYDLCAGTGAMGIEALSRRADKVYFFEPQPLHFRFLKENMNRLYTRDPSCQEKIILNKIKFQRYFFEQSQQDQNIYYFDPPYAQIELYDEFLKKALVLPWSQIWIELDQGLATDFLSRLHRAFNGLSFQRYQQGEHCIIVYRKDRL